MERANVPAAGPAHDAGGLGGHPRGLMTLYFTEMWERFSYYGMRSFLIVFMVTAAAQGGLGFDVKRGTIVYGTYTMAVYLLSIPGGFLADNFLGARRSVLWGGSLIALGHFVLALPSLTGFYAGLGLVVAGTGLLKPNISAMVGGLYAPGDERRDAGFSLFYMGINLGAFIAPLVCGFLAQSDAFKSWLSGHGFDPARSWHWGFAAAGVGMTLGLAQYVLGGRRLAHVGAAPAGGLRPWLTLSLVLAGTAALMGLVLLSDLVGSLAWIRYVYLARPWRPSSGSGSGGTPPASGSPPSSSSSPRQRSSGRSTSRRAPRSRSSANPSPTGACRTAGTSPSSATASRRAPRSRRRTSRRCPPCSSSSWRPCSGGSGCGWGPASRPAS